MKNRASLKLLLSVAFLDYMGVGLVLPLFTNLFFNTSLSLFPAETSNEIRGMWVGILVSLAFLFKFLSAPILGAVSDQKGRKKMILFGYGVGCLAYFLGVLGVKFSSLSLLIAYRALLGISLGVAPAIEAAIADMSTTNTKARNFSLYNMMWGAGFSLGPFLGGMLSDASQSAWFSLYAPFLMAVGITAFNVILIAWKFQEPRKIKERSKIDIFRGVRHVGMIFQHPVLRYSFFAFVFFIFGWDFYVEFIGLTLNRLYQFTIPQVGHFHAYLGLLFAVSNGFLIKPFFEKFSSQKLLLFSLIFSGPYLMTSLFIENPYSFFTFLPPFLFLSALFYPAASTHISNNTTEDKQGEIFGLFYSFQAIALVIIPLLSGSLMGKIPKMTIYVSGCLMMIGGIVFALGVFKSRFKTPRLEHREEI